MRMIPINYGKKQALTICRLIKITTVDNKVFGLCSLDVDLLFKGVVYKKTGNDTSVIEDDNDFSIANAETQTLLTVELSDKAVEAGLLDNASWELYEVDYRKLDDYIVLDRGMIGLVKIEDKSLTMELLSISNKLTVPFGCVDSKRCRAVFGTEAKSIFGCGVDASNMWEQGTVTGVDGKEPDILFADSNLQANEQQLKRAARVQFTSGKNASEFLYQVEDFSGASGTILLMEATPHKIEVGDTFKIRPDCDKIPNTCKAYNNFINYKGEPFIPSQDAVSASVPYGYKSGIVSGIDD